MTETSHTGPPRPRPLPTAVYALLAGAAVGLGLTLGLALISGWAAALLNASYTAVCGSVACGLFLARRLGPASAQAKIYGLAAGLLVGLAIPYAAWLAAPHLGYTVGPFKGGPQALLGAVGGFVGAWLSNRRSKLPSLVDDIRRRR